MTAKALMKPLNGRTQNFVSVCYRRSYSSFFIHVSKKGNEISSGRKPDRNHRSVEEINVRIACSRGK